MSLMTITPGIRHGEQTSDLLTQPSNFAAKLEELMTEIGLTQAALAKEIGVSQRAVSGWLHGAIPHSRRLAKIASFFGVSVFALMKGAT